MVYHSQPLDVKNLPELGQTVACPQGVYDHKAIVQVWVNKMPD